MILITGGSGFIGSHLVAHLKGLGHKVFNYDLAEGYDLLDEGMMSRVFKHFKPKQVYHLGGSVHMEPAEEDPLKDMQVNYGGTLNILRQCEKHGSRLLYTGTGASYGLCGSIQREDDPPMPVSNYGISKLAAELLVRKYVWCHGLQGVVTRFSSVYGPRRNAGPVNLMLRNALQKRWIRVDGAGHHTRDLVEVGDALEGAVTVMEKGKPGEVYNIGSGVETSIVELAWMIHELTGAEIRHVPFKYSAFDVPRSRYDVEKARALGYEPKVSIRDGVKRLYEAMKAE